MCALLIGVIGTAFGGSRETREEGSIDVEAGVDIVGASGIDVDPDAEPAAVGATPAHGPTCLCEVIGESRARRTLRALMHPVMSSP
jgi:hypothetical protein